MATKTEAIEEIVNAKAKKTIYYTSKAAYHNVGDSEEVSATLAEKFVKLGKATYSEEEALATVKVITEETTETTETTGATAGQITPPSA